MEIFYSVCVRSHKKYSVESVKSARTQASTGHLMSSVAISVILSVMECDP